MERKRPEKTDYDMAAVKEAAEAVRLHSSVKPKIGLILGSGLGSVAKEVKGDAIPYSEIPHFPVSTVEGHAGDLCLGELAGKPVVVMSGRFHFYEGYSLQQVTFPVRVMRELGCETLIVTNAAGGINTEFDVGDLMLITSHINFLGSNPLFGPNVEQGPRFPDMTMAYDADLAVLAEKVANDQDLKLRKGVYIASMGPSYETPAEINMYRSWGGDAAGMSTVPEVIVGRHSGMRILGISCITNMAAGVLPQPLSHEEVIETTGRIRSVFRDLVLGIVEKL